MRINGLNLGSLKISNRLSQTSRALARSFERLASGRAVSSPADGSAAYSLGVRLDSQLRGTAAANQNINQALGLVNTAASALDQLQDIVLEMQQISRVGSDSSLSDTERSNLQTGLTELFTEFNRIRSSTEYNDINLLDGTFDSTRLLTGANAGSFVDLNLSEAQGIVASGSTSIDTFNGLGTFTFSTAPDVISNRNNISNLADIDGDGDLDALGFEGTGSGGDTDFVVWINDGDGNFSSGGTITANDNIDDGQLVDVNRDGNVDAVFATDSSLSIYLGDGTGSFSLENTYAIDGLSNGFITFMDLDGDDNIDIINQSSTVDEVFMGNGDGSFSSGATFAGSQSFGDFNNDGVIDIVNSDSGDLSIWMGDGDGAFTETYTESLGATVSISVGDIDGDFVDDIVLSEGVSDEIYFRLSNGDGSFSTGSTYTAGALNSSPIQLGDVDNDGDLDLVTLVSGSAYELLLNDGSGSFSFNETITVDSALRPNLIDINGDGNLDIVDPAGDTIQIVLGSGDGNFAAATTSPYSSTGGAFVLPSSDIEFGDLNADGVLDFLLGSYNVAGGTDDDTSAYIQDTSVTTETFNFGVSVQNEYSASNLEDVLENVLENLQSQRAEVSAIHSRLTANLESNLLLSENLSQSREAVVGVDIVDEVLNSLTQQFLLDAQTAALSQNQVNASAVLSLLDSLL